MWIKRLSRRITLLTEWMMDTGYERIPDRFGEQFSVRKLKSENKGGMADVFWDDEETKEKALIISREYDKDKNFLRNIAKKSYGFCDSLISTSYEIAKFDLSKDSNEKLLSYFKDYIDKFKDLMVAVYITFPTELFLTERVLQDLRIEFKDELESKIQQYFSVLTTMPKESDMFLEQKELLDIAISLKSNPSQIAEKIKRHSNLFGWMGVEDNSLLGGPWTREYFLKELREIENPEERLRALLENRRREIENYEKAFSYVFNYKEDITKNFILKIHRILTRNALPEDRSGKFRKVQVIITGVEIIPPKPEVVEKDIEQLIKWYNKYKRKYHPVILAPYFHAAFEGVHPFVDFNGRTGRLLLNFILMKNGYPIIDVKYKDRLKYYDALQDAQKNNLKSFVNLVAKYIKEELIRVK